MRSLISARGKVVSGVLHGVMSSRGTTGNTQVQSPLNATTATGKGTQKLLAWGGDLGGGLEVGCSCSLQFITSLSHEGSLGPGNAFYFFTGKTNEIRVSSCM